VWPKREATDSPSSRSKFWINGVFDPRILHVSIASCLAYISVAGSCDLRSDSVSMFPYQFINGGTKLMYIMAPESILAVYLINSSHQSVSVCVSLLILLFRGLENIIPYFNVRQRLGKHGIVYKHQHKNCRALHLLCGPCLINGEFVDLSVYLLNVAR
jgi:hypothetical protein